MLQVSNLTKSYGSRTLFEGVSFSLCAGERLGLLGRNGSGKSTLFRLILDEEHLDSGSIVFPRGYRIGHLAQHLQFTEPTILKEACLGLPEDSREQEYRAEIILSGLGFSEEDYHRAPAEFSGGFQIRVNLAKLLLSEPNLLLLDEPTNYLDIVSVRWLKTFLRNWPNELIIISHDRLFMDSVTTHSMLIHRGATRKMPGDSVKLYSQISLDEEIYEKTRVNEEKKRKDLEIFINRFRAKASKASLVQSKIKTLEKIGRKEELSDEDSLDFRFCEAEHPGKVVSEVRELSFAYPQGPILIQNLNLLIGKNDRIGVIGKNGKGKSTLLRLLAGELTPGTGEISRSPNARIGYFGQTNISRLHAGLTIEQEISEANPNLHRTKVRGICGTMMFSGDDALKKISVLSGGEKSRVLLGKILAQPTNLLLLDEPTNHLDMESIEALIDSLKDYQGALVIVTHSELILRELATRLIIFQGDTPILFNHDYDYFLNKRGWGEEQELSQTRSVSSPKPAKVGGPGAASKQEKALTRKIKLIEEKIIALETELEIAEQNLAEAFQKGDQEEGSSLSIRLSELQSQIERSFEDLEEASKLLKQ